MKKQWELCWKPEFSLWIRLTAQKKINNVDMETLTGLDAENDKSEMNSLPK